MGIQRALVVFALVPSLAIAGGVRGYTKENGTYVEPHNRTDPNDTVNDNYSTKGNVNPYTGKPGTKQPGSYGAGFAYSQSAPEEEEPPFRISMKLPMYLLLVGLAALAIALPFANDPNNQGTATYLNLTGALLIGASVPWLLALVFQHFTIENSVFSW